MVNTTRKDADGRDLKSLIATESWRLRRAGKDPKEAHWLACANVGTMFDPPMTADEVNSIASAYTVAAANKARSERKMGAPSDSGRGDLGDGWFTVTEPIRSRHDELTLYLSDLQPGGTRMKRGLTKNEAKLWQTAVSAWARHGSRKSVWYDKNTPRFRTSVVLVEGEEYAIVIHRNL